MKRASHEERLSLLEQRLQNYRLRRQELEDDLHIVEVTSADEDDAEEAVGKLQGQITQLSRAGDETEKMIREVKTVLGRKSGGKKKKRGKS